MNRILIVEDETVTRSVLKRLLEKHSYQVGEATSVQEATSKYDLSDFDLVITDLRLPGAQGTDLIQNSDKIPVLIMTSYASLKSAVESMKMGAVDYIAKPFDHDEMLISIQRILKERNQARQTAALKSDLSKLYPTDAMIGNCQAMQEVLSRIAKVAPISTTVLVRGESGTGKELVARALHDQSLRTDAPMISVNCAAIPDTLIESELFGHEKGSFTGATNARKGLVEAADGGTLFLDEIGELPMEAQGRLLRVIQEGEIRRIGSTTAKKVDIRLIAATHRNLKLLTEQGKFREDLYYRLHVMEITMPPLRDRGDDIVVLAKALLSRTCEKLNKPRITLSEDTLKAIKYYTWPGNVRELENAIERAVILTDGDSIEPPALAIEFRKEPELNETSRQTDKPLKKLSDPSEELSLEDYFLRFVMENQEHMTETELAQKLGISRKTLWERRQRLSITRKKSDENE